ELRATRGAGAAPPAERSRRSLYLGQLASAHASLGQPEIGLDLLDEAIRTAEVTSEKLFEAELHRLRGDILLTLGRRAEAEAGLRRAGGNSQPKPAPLGGVRPPAPPPHPFPPPRQ